MRIAVSPSLVSILKWTCCIELVGKSYQHFFFPPVYQFVEDGLTSTLSLVFAFLFLLGSISVLFADFGRKWIQIPLAILSVILVWWSISKYVNSGYQLAQLIELSLQSLLPTLVWLSIYQKQIRWASFVFKLGIALTFLGHGLYALGVFYPVPNHFIAMVMQSLSIFGIEEATARTILLMAGIMDTIVAIGLFIPAINTYVLKYAFVWGLLTSLARLTSYIRLGPDFWVQLHRWGYEFLVRVPHFMIPYLVLKEEEAQP